MSGTENLLESDTQTQGRVSRLPQRTQYQVRAPHTLTAPGGSLEDHKDS